MIFNRAFNTLKPLFSQKYPVLSELDVLISYEVRNTVKMMQMNQTET